MFKFIKNLPDFIRAELLISIIAVAEYSFLGPIITKLEGMLFTVTVISILTGIDRFKGVIVYMLRGLNLTTTYKIMFVIVITHICITITYFIDQKVFIWLIIINSALGGIFFRIFYIEWDAIIANILNKNDFKEFSHIDSLLNTVVGVISLSIVVMLSLYDTDILVITNICLNFIALYLMFKQYKNFYTNEKLKEILKDIE